MKFRDDHPLSLFNDYLYLDSGDSGVAMDMPIYIFRNGEKGVLIEMRIPSRNFKKINNPSATIFGVKFYNDYDWDLGRKLKVIEDPSIDGLNSKVAKYLKGKLYGEQS